MRKIYLLLVLVLAAFYQANAQVLLKPIPDKLVVLTFDDAVVSQATFVAPLLKKYGFGGTFFVCEFPPNFEDKTKYMSWVQIQELGQLGFEVASHTKNHAHVSNLNQEQFRAELEYIEQKCQELQIQKPETFAYPGYSTHPDAFQILQAKGYQFARAGGSRPYDPEKDHPYLLPSYSTTGTDKQRILDAIGQAKDGKVVIFTVHGVPDTAHDWVTTPPALFKEYLKYLHDNKYQVIALRDLKKYVNVAKALTEIKPVFTNLTNSP